MNRYLQLLKKEEEKKLVFTIVKNVKISVFTVIKEQRNWYIL